MNTIEPFATFIGTMVMAVVAAVCIIGLFSVGFNALVFISNKVKNIRNQ